MSTSPTKLEFSHDGVATLSLMRAAEYNSLDLEACRALEESAKAIARNADVRAVLLRSEGGAFCVGGDLKSISASSDPSRLVNQMVSAAHNAILTLRSLDAPLVVAVQGPAAGGGFSLALCGDIVLAGHDKASFSYAYPMVGLPSDLGATWFLPRLVGLRRAQELILSNRRIKAVEAAEMGLITAVVDDAKLDDVALRRAKEIAAGATTSFGAIRHLLDKSLAASLAQQLDCELSEMTRLAGMPESRARIQAFLANRRDA